jgi:hypothetical protein
MSSSSVILSNILVNESCELREAIDGYMNMKCKELQEILKSKLESIITNKLDKFYNKSFEEHEKVLFDKNGTDLINNHNSYIERIFIKSARSYTHFEILEFKNLNFLSKENTKCFTIAFADSYEGGKRFRELSFYKTFLIERNSYPPCQGYLREWSISSFKHNLTTDCLFAIKYFQVANVPVPEACCLSTINLNTSIKLLEEHPEYFKKNCSDFEDICRREYAEIEKTKSYLKTLIDEQISKKNYYESLEKKIKDIEIEKKQLDEEMLKFKNKLSK